MLLAAGRGTRLGELGLQIPKALVDIAGEPLLARQLRYLARSGVERVVVNAHHLSEAIEKFAGEYTGGPELTVVVEPELLGTAGAVANARPLLGQGPVLVLYGDVLIREPLAPLMAFHRSGGFEAVVTVYESDFVEGKGTVTVGEGGRVLGFVEKATATAGRSAWINAGLYVLSPQFIDSIPAGVANDFGHDTFPAALASGRRLGAYALSEPVIDVGTPEGLTRAREVAAAGFETDVG